MDRELAQQIGNLVEAATGAVFRPTSFEPRHGGCIHQAGVCSDGKRCFFFKSNRASFHEQFAAEADGLQALRAADAIRVPTVIGHAVAGDRSVLVMEALDLSGGTRARNWARMGEQLARLHRKLGQAHGWHRDNFIGATPQSNREHPDWASFFVEQRLRPQLDLARAKGMSFAAADALLEKVPGLLAGHDPAPSLLHGDLWSGNAGFTADGEPVLFDPAVHHGDRECDLAFSRFFGGFPEKFYRAYEAAWPLADGHARRVDLYNLYHVLNHANLFGGGYANQADAMIRSLTGRS